MASVASVRSQGQTALAQQKKKDDALVLKGLILTIDKFVESLVERLGNPNKTFLGKPAPLSQTDTKFKDCLSSIKTYLGTGLMYRSSFSKISSTPPQYEKLQKMFDNTLTGTPLKQTYNQAPIEFMERFRKLFLFLKDGGLETCNDYVRVKNLFSGSTTESKEKFDFKQLYERLNENIKPVKQAIENKELNELLDLAIEGSVFEARQTMPMPATGTDTSARLASMPRTIGSTDIEEPEPVISESEVTTAMSTTSAAPAGQTELTAKDKFEIVRIKSALLKDNYQKVKDLSDEKLQQLAERLYRRRQTGKSRKTYRKKKHHRKTRKVRRS